MFKFFCTRFSNRWILRVAKSKTCQMQHCKKITQAVSLCFRMSGCRHIVLCCHWKSLTNVKKVKCRLSFYRQRCRAHSFVSWSCLCTCHTAQSSCITSHLVSLWAFQTLLTRKKICWWVERIFFPVQFSFFSGSDAHLWKLPEIE